MEKIKIENYGDLLSKAMGKKCLGYVLFGSYQGEWVAILDNSNEIELWKGSYGSCSGCDYLEGCDYEMTEEEIKNYFKEDRAFLTVKKDIIKNISKEEFETLLPANIRNDIYDFDCNLMFKEIKKVVN